MFPVHLVAPVLLEAPKYLAGSTTRGSLVTPPLEALEALLLAPLMIPLL